jgi:hypothetical protein
VITESERAKKLEQRLNEAEEERTILRQERDEQRLVYRYYDGVIQNY